MGHYRRLYQKGGLYFFTLVTHQRKPIFNTDIEINILRSAFRKTMEKRPFTIKAIVILPDHLHCIWQLPEEDKDFSSRWKIIKGMVTKKYHSIFKNQNIVWQPRYWEHLIRDEKDLYNHLDYIHYNPVKHGFVSKPLDWPYSSFHNFVQKGVYEKAWGDTGLKDIEIDVGEPL